MTKQAVVMLLFIVVILIGYVSVKYSIAKDVDWPLPAALICAVLLAWFASR